MISGSSDGPASAAGVMSATFSVAADVVVCIA
jgi:hypothetical protein